MEQPYKIIEVNDKEITIIDLPFSNQFDFEHYIDENRLVYTLESTEGMSFYLVTLESR